MSDVENPSLPIFEVTAENGRSLHLVMSVSTFRKDQGEAPETILPVVQQALNLAQEISGSDTLLSFYLHAAPGDVVVRRVRNIVIRSLQAEHPVLWLRADSEHFLKAALNIIQVDYARVRVITPKFTQESLA